MQPQELSALIKSAVSPLPVTWIQWATKTDPLTRQWKGPRIDDEADAHPFNVTSPALLLVGVGSGDEALVCAYILESDESLQPSRLGCPDAPGWEDQIFPEVEAALQFLAKRPHVLDLKAKAVKDGEAWDLAQNAMSAIEISAEREARRAMEYTNRYPWLTPGQRFLVALGFLEGVYGENAWQ